jgi:hypothetical protein
LKHSNSHKQSHYHPHQVSIPEKGLGLLDISRNYDFATNCQGFQLGFWTLLEMSIETEVWRTVRQMVLFQSLRRD